MQNVRQFINGMNFPADKRQILDYARSHNAPDDVMRNLERMRDKRYSDPAEVSREVSI